MNPIGSGGRLNRRERQRDSKDAAASDAGAFGGDRAAVKFNQIAHDSETQPEAAIGALGAGIGLPKPFENVRKKLRKNALASVPYNNLEVRINPLHEHLDLAATGRELDRIRKQIPDDLLQPFLVAGDKPGARVGDNAELDIPGVSRGPHGVHGVFDDRRQLDSLDVKAQFSGSDAGDVEQVFDQLGL